LDLDHLYLRPDAGRVDLDSIWAVAERIVSIPNRERSGLVDTLGLQAKGGRLMDSEEQYLAAHAQGFNDGISAAAAWLRHIDRLDEVPGAKEGLPLYNPLWDASIKLEEDVRRS
jgi:hypothetical protein